MELTSFDSGHGHVKAGFLGFTGSGKTFTATLLMCAAREHFGLTEPVAFFDTETGAVYVDPMVKHITGQSIIGARSRALSELLEMAQQCADGAACGLVVDSVTHVWREVCQAYLAEVNQIRSTQGKSERTRLEFQDWAIIKDKWAAWPDLFLNAPLHMAICGRAGYDWDFEEREDATGRTRKELVKTGIKMKVESEFGFEPSLLVDMRRESQFNREKSEQEALIHKAVVLKDRTGLLDGAERVFATVHAGAGLDYTAMYDAVKNFFMPHLDALTPGASNTVDTAPKTKIGVDAQGDIEWQRERRARTVACEEIQGLLVEAWPGQTKDEKRLKSQALNEVFGTRSWSKVERMSARELTTLMPALEAFIAQHKETENDG